jgi:hypothetical protein
MLKGGGKAVDKRWISGGKAVAAEFTFFKLVSILNS